MRERILIVEDEEHIGISLRFNFEAEGYEPQVAEDGVTALNLFHAARAKSRPFQLIVLDLMLPRMSGYEVCQQMRLFDRTVPILVLSARSLAEDRIQAFDAGTDQYLQKPFSLPELLSRVRNLLERHPTPKTTDAASEPPAPSAPTTLRFGNATVNFLTHEVAVKGEPKNLSPLHLQLLRFFCDNEGAVHSREKILEQVWGYDLAPTTTRVVDNAVLVLRKTFEEDSAKPRHFLSVRGAGYRFVRDSRDGTPPEEDQADPPAERSAS